MVLTATGIVNKDSIHNRKCIARNKPEKIEYMMTFLSKRKSLLKIQINQRIELAIKTLQKAQERAVAPDNNTNIEDDEILKKIVMNMITNFIYHINPCVFSKEESSEYIRMNQVMSMCL